MNESENHNSPNFFGRVAKDDGVQRAAAGIVVALVVASTKQVLFSGK